MDFDGIIYIADSSEPHEAQANREIINERSGKLYIHYHHIEAPHDGAATALLNPYIHESVKYVCFAGDDDFQIPAGLKLCEKFLEENTDYVACHGHRANFTFQGDSVRLLNLRHGYDWDDSFSQLDRVQEYFRAGIALAGYLHTKEAWIERYKPCSTIPVRYLGGELVQECTTALLGKVKFLQDTVSFLFYQDNPDRVFSFDKTTLFDLMNSPDWSKSFHRTLGRLTDLMETPDSDWMYKELYFHVVAILSSQYQMRFGIPEGSKTSTINYDYGVLVPEISDLLKLIGEITQQG